MAKLTTPAPTGWTTFYTIRMPDGHTALVQKRADGTSRTIIASTGAHR